MNVKIRFTGKLDDFSRSAQVDITSADLTTDALASILKQVRDFVSMENIELKYESPATPTDEALTAVRTLTPSTPTLGPLKADFVGKVHGTVAPQPAFKFDLPASMEDKLKEKQAAEIAAAKEELKAAFKDNVSGRVEPAIRPTIPATSGTPVTYESKPRTEVSENEPAERSRKLPYINNERTLGVSLADLYPELGALLQEAADTDGEGKNKPHFSGIRFTEDGAPLFKIRYHCRDLNCQNMGNRYVFDGSAYCKCHRCATKLKLRPVLDGPQDDNGNFMYATELYIEGMNE